MRKFLAFTIIVAVIFSVSFVFGNTGNTESFEVAKIGEQINLGNVQFDEVFIPIATGDYIIFGGREGRIADIYSCNQETKEIIKLSSNPIPHVLAAYPAHMLAVSDGWVAYQSQVIGRDGKLWITHANGESEPKNVASDDATITSYPVFEDGHLYFWQESESAENTGFYRYNPKTDSKEMVYQNTEAKSSYLKIYHDSKYFMFDELDGTAIIIDKNGKEIAEMSLPSGKFEDNIYMRNTFLKLATGFVLYQKNILEYEDGKKPIPVSKEFYVYDIEMDETTKVGDCADIGSTANQVNHNPNCFSFLNMIPKDGPVPEYFEWELQVYNPKTKTFHAVDYNGPYDSKNDYRGRLYSSTDKNLTVYPSGQGHDSWHLDVFDSNKKVSYRITDKADIYLYSSINDGKICYFIENDEKGGFDLVYQLIESSENKSPETLDRKILFEENSSHLLDIKKEMMKPRVYGDYLVWFEEDSENNSTHLYSYNFDTGKKQKVTDNGAFIVPFGWGGHNGYISENFYADKKEKLMSDDEPKLIIHSLDGKINRTITEDGTNRYIIHDIKGDYLYLTKLHDDEKFDGCFKYNMREDKFEFLFNPGKVKRSFHGIVEKTYAEFYPAADNFLVVGDNDSIYISDKDGTKERVLVEHQQPEKNHTRYINEIFKKIGDDFIIVSKKVNLDSSPFDDDFEISRKYYYYSLTKDCVYQFQKDFGSISNNAIYKDSEIVITISNFEKDKEALNFDYKALNPTNGTNIDFATKVIKKTDKSTNPFMISKNIIAYRNNDNKEYKIFDALTG